MSGFFANLLSRSRGTADVVRPRLASLFEPGAPRVSRADGVSPADEPPDGPATMAAAGPVPITASPAQGLALSRDPGGRRAAPRPPHGHDRLSHDDRRIVGDSDTDARIGTRGRGGQGWEAGDEALELVNVRRRSAGGNGGAADGRRTHGDRADRTAPAASAAAGEAAAIADVGAGDVTSMSAAGTWSPSTVRAATRLAPGTRAGVSPRSNGSSGRDGEPAAGDASLAADTTPTAALVAAARPPASLAPLPAHPSSSRRHAAAASRAGADAHAGEPVIEISIGRIDVRAAVERGSDRRASAAPSPVMGLAEYLQARAGARGGPR
jgi:hypothetical protein